MHNAWSKAYLHVMEYFVIAYIAEHTINNAAKNVRRKVTAAKQQQNRTHGVTIRS